MKTRVVELGPEKIAIGLAVLLVVLGAAAYLVLISPNQSKSSGLSTTIKSAQSTLQKLSTQSTPHTTAQKHAVSQALMTSRALPNVTAMPQILLQLSRISNEEHVSLDSVTPGGPVPYTGYTSVPMTLSITGDYFGVQGFLQQLLRQVSTSKDGVAATGRLYDVLAVTIATSATPPKVTATLTVNAFFYTPVVIPPPGAATTTSTTSTGG